jgi:2-polyprenyl-6-methoxyphenol hydroxylase-like FAD-dependent oxidoreductase
VCSCHWALLHHVLSAALPEGILHLGHTMTSFENIDGGRRVRVHVAGREEPFEGDLMVAADGTMSQTREKLVGDQRR